MLCLIHIRNFSHFREKVFLNMSVLRLIFFCILRQFHHIFRVRWHKNCPNRPILTSTYCICLTYDQREIYRYDFLKLTFSKDFKNFNLLNVPFSIAKYSFQTDVYATEKGFAPFFPPYVILLFDPT